MTAMTAKNKFRIGQKVKFTREAVRSHIRPHLGFATGVVVGFPRDIANSVRVLIDGQKTPGTFWKGFWTAR